MVLLQFLRSHNCGSVQIGQKNGKQQSVAQKPVSAIPSIKGAHFASHSQISGGVSHGGHSGLTNVLPSQTRSALQNAVVIKIYALIMHLRSFFPSWRTCRRSCSSICCRSSLAKFCGEAKSAYLFCSKIIARSSRAFIVVVLLLDHSLSFLSALHNSSR